MKRAARTIVCVAILMIESSRAWAQTPPSNLRTNGAASVLAQPGPGAVVIPRENCGTFWTEWGADPEADSNPCPPACERGERQVLDSRKAADQEQYHARYQCYLPELFVNQPAGVLQIAAGAPARQNCGTFWTSAQSDPSTAANPCPANCERGELQTVRRSFTSDGGARYEMRYQCYVAQPGATATAQSALSATSTDRVTVKSPATPAASAAQTTATTTTLAAPALPGVAVGRALQGGVPLHEAATPQRVLSLAGFSAAGNASTAPPHTFVLRGFTAAGTGLPVPTHQFVLTGWTSAGPSAAP